jgi:hypothetical protein
MWHIHGLFHPFEVKNLGAMVSVMSMLTAKRKREVHLEVFFVVPPLVFVVIVPLKVLVTLILVSPSRLVLLGVISSCPGLLLFQFFPLFLALFE